MVDCSVNFMGLKLKNPLIAAAGPVTSNVEMVETLAENGIAAIVTKTGFTKNEYEKWVGRKNIFPYKPVYKYQSLINGRLLSLPTLLDVPVNDTAKRVERLKKIGIPIIGSIMGLSIRGYVESAKMLENAGVDAIELDLCCTIPEFTSIYKYTGQNVNFYPKIYSKLIQEVKRNVSVPVGAKSSVSLYLYAKIFEGLIRSKIKNCLPDSVTLVGQLDQNPGINLDTLKPVVPHIPTFGWQGDLSFLTFSALAVFSSTLGTKILPLSASGGIKDYKDVIQSLMFGAATVQLQSVILDKGPEIVSKILTEMENYLNSKGILRIDELIGVTSKEFIPALMVGRFMRERDKLFGLVTAKVQPDLCNGCGICKSICTERAIEIIEKKAVIPEKVKCRACNLCILKCPRKAISLDNQAFLDEFIDNFRNTSEIESFRKFMSKNRIGLMDILLMPWDLKKWGLG